jgi:hypothetical protein
MSFPDKEQRAACWQGRDRYWECLDKNAPEFNSSSGEGKNQCFFYSHRLIIFVK